MQRIKSGIPGFDELVGGGIPKNQLLLITGTSGTGKTIFCMQYLNFGAKGNEPGVYLSFEEPAEYIRQNASVFGWDFNALEKKRKIAIMRYDPYRIEDVIDILESTIKEIGATRVAIDSISALGLYVKDRAELRRMIFDISLLLRRLGCTALIVSEIVPGSPGLSRYGVEEFVADSVIVFYYERVESQFLRAIQVWKMRGSPHSQKMHPYHIDKNGIRILPEEEAFIKK
ncbi:MAG: ATPase domain-containing protein [Candidatus Aenigmatarchaeota archaeon]